MVAIKIFHNERLKFELVRFTFLRAGPRSQGLPSLTLKLHLLFNELGAAVGFLTKSLVQGLVKDKLEQFV